MFTLFFILIVFPFAAEGYTIQPLVIPPRGEYEKIKQSQEFKDSCILCTLSATDTPTAHYILHESSSFLCMLNRYPYAPGHLLIVSKRHVATLLELTNEELFELIIFVQGMVKQLMISMSADGYNIGINQGKAAGASIPDHFHLHIVPRRNGDVGFIETIGQSHCIDAQLEHVYAALIKEIQKD